MTVVNERERERERERDYLYLAISKLYSTLSRKTTILSIKYHISSLIFLLYTKRKRDSFQSFIIRRCATMLFAITASKIIFGSNRPFINQFK